MVKAEPGDAVNHERCSYWPATLVVGKVHPLAFVILAIAAVTALAQVVESQSAELWFEIEYVVKPTKNEEFEGALREVRALWTEEAWPYPVSVSGPSDSRYYVAVPLRAYAQLDTVTVAMARFHRLAGPTVTRQLNGAIESYAWSVWRYVRELSYVPDRLRLPAETTNYLVWLDYRPKPEHESDFLAILRQLRDLVTSRGVRDKISVFRREFGPDKPYYFIELAARDSLDFNAALPEARGLCGSECEELFRQLVATAARSEITQSLGAYRPDLSYSPARP